MTAVDKAKRVARWIAERPPRTLLITGWVVFILGSYPGYMSFDSTMQLYDVRNRIYTDAHAPVMTALWGLLEWVVAGPLPMLVLQSGLFLFGLAAVLRTITSPRAAAVTAVALLLFPPVFAPMAVIWRDSLMAGALLGAAGAALQHTNRWRAVAAVLLVIACSCRPAIALAILPIVVLAIPHQIWWRRAVLAVAATIAIAATARIADWALTDKTTYTASQSLRMVDVVGTLRRASVSDEARLRESLQGLPIASETELVERVTRYRTAYDWWSLAHGEKRIFEPIETDEQNDALRAAWWRVIADYPGAYVTHRLGIARRLVGIGTRSHPVYDSFGERALLQPLHHRASRSDWQTGMRKVVRAAAATPLFAPWLYLGFAIPVLVLVWRVAAARALVISGLVYFLTLLVLAPSPEYRFAHWLVTTTAIAVAVLITRRRWPA